MRIVFFGTPVFAATSLDAMVAAGLNVVAVVTAPDKPAGRGMQLNQSAVKVCALKHQLPVLQPMKLKDEQFIEELKSYHADIQVVIAFRMLPKMVWNMPRLGTLNLHASLLPDYRGAAPINWAIIQGETKTGVSTFFLKHEIDTGDILLSKEVGISPTVTAGELHDILMNEGASLVIQSIQQVEAGTVQGQPQTNGSTKTAPKIFKETCEINWNQSVQQVYNFVRGLSPYPTAFTTLDGKILKVFTSEIEVGSPEIEPGNFLTDQKNFLKFACADGYLHLLDLQLESKKRMDVKSFLIGYQLNK